MWSLDIKLTFNKYRTKDENMIQIAVCPGKPKDIVSFLESLVKEVKAMYERGLVIKKEGNEIFRGRVVILRFTGDIPGITKIMYFVDHVGTYGCHVYKSKALTTRPITS